MARDIARFVVRKVRQCGVCVLNTQVERVQMDRQVKRFDVWTRVDQSVRALDRGSVPHEKGTFSGLNHFIARHCIAQTWVGVGTVRR